MRFVSQYSLQFQFFLVLTVHLLENLRRMSEIWSSDQLTINMASFSDISVSEEDSLLSTWLSHAIQFDGNCTGIEHNIFDQYEACENPMEVYGTMGAYSDVFQSRYVEQSPNYACSGGISLSMEIGRTSPQYNSVDSSGYICSSLQDPTAISYYWQEDCMNSCPSDQSGVISVSPSSSSSCEQKGSHLRVQHNISNEGFPVGFDEFPAFHSCSEDLMKNMAELHFSNLPVYNIVMQNLSEGEKDDAGNLQKVDAVFKSKSEGDDQMCYVNQFPPENETNRMPINDAVEDPHPPSKRHCSERLMADRVKVNAMPAVESSSLMPASIQTTLSSTAGRACNSDGKPRARRGSATDPQSLYARQRRERINERLKVLQNLIPNGTKVDISTMLEEALHYVKSLQLQIKILSSDDHWMQGPIAFHAVRQSHMEL